MDVAASTLDGNDKKNSPKKVRDPDRSQLLAAISEAYYIEGLDQTEIAERFGFNRSAISRHLTEARDAGIVEIKVHREFSLNDRLGAELSAKSLGTNVHVINASSLGTVALNDIVARYTSRLLYERFNKKSVLAITLGTMVLAVARALSVLPPTNIEIVQMCGSVGNTGINVDSHAIVQLLSTAYRTEGTYLHAPFLVENRTMLEALLRNPGNLASVNKCKTATIALVGLGTLDTETSSLARGGHVSQEIMATLKRMGAVGDVGGYVIDREGTPMSDPDYVPVIAVSNSEFRQVPMRVGSAVGQHKAEIIAAALRSGILTELITDSATANTVATMI